MASQVQHTPAGGRPAPNLTELAEADPVGNVTLVTLMLQFHDDS